MTLQNPTFYQIDCIKKGYVVCMYVLCLVTEMSLINVMNDTQLYIHLRLDSFDMLLLLTCCMLVCVCGVH